MYDGKRVEVLADTGMSLGEKRCRTPSTSAGDDDGHPPRLEASDQQPPSQQTATSTTTIAASARQPTTCPSCVDELERHLRRRDDNATTMHEDGDDKTAPSQQDGTVLFEQRYVHDVYDIIAPHFSSTRYNVWPKIRALVTEWAVLASGAEMPRGSCGESSSSASSMSRRGVLIADVGCGNGKNMCVASQEMGAFAVGCDRSAPLMRAAALGARRVRQPLPPNQQVEPEQQQPQSPVDEVTTTNSKNNKKQRPPHPQQPKKRPPAEPVRIPALERGLEMTVADGITTPYRSGLFDIVLSIAVIHHFASEERRVLAIRELVRLAVPETGRVLIYVWAREQNERRCCPTARQPSAAAVSGAADNQSDDSHAPASSSSPPSSASSLPTLTADVFVPWELQKQFKKKSNPPGTIPQQQEQGPTLTVEDPTTSSPTPATTTTVYNRYYHMFAQGELERLCLLVNTLDKGGASTSTTTRIQCEIVESFFDKENWCIVLKRLC